MSQLTATLSGTIAEWIDELRYADLGTEVREGAVSAIINSVGTAIGGFGFPSVDRALAYTRHEASSGPAHVLVTGETFSVGSAAFVNAVMMNALGQEETHLPTGTHPAETAVPVLLAAAERAGSSGQEIVEALVAAVEVTAALASMRLTPAVKYDRCQAPAVYGTVGGAAGLAKLTKLSPEQATNALGLAANFASGLSECIRAGTGEYHYLKGLAARNSHLAVELACQGAVAAPTTFEGPGGFYHLFGGADRAELARHDVAGDVRGRLGHDWATPQLAYKPYPVHFFNQLFVAGALEIRRRLGAPPWQLESVRVEVGQLAAASGGLSKGPFSRRENTLGSSAFCVAAALARGRVGVAETADFEAPDITSMLKLTDVIIDEGLDTCRIRVRARTGSFEFDAARERGGHLTRAKDVPAIFLAAAARTLDSSTCEDLLGRLLSVTDAANLRDVLSPAWRGGRQPEPARDHPPGTAGNQAVSGHPEPAAQAAGRPADGPGRAGN